MIIGPTFASEDTCEDFNSAPEVSKANYFAQLKRQHLVVHHSSVEKASDHEKLIGQKALYTELCKTPFHHRDSLRQNGIEIHLVGGSIEQHPFIKKLMEKGITPRNHDEHGVNFGDLPGVGSNGDPDSPIILDLLTLTRPISKQNHGSGSLVLHEFAHAVDFFFIRKGKSKDYISKTSSFKKISRTFNWKIFIPDFEFPQRLTFTKQGNYFVSNTGLHYSEEAMNEYLIYYEKALKETTQNNINLEGIRQYHVKNYEEAFAEIYTRWYSDPASRIKINNSAPAVGEYFKNLEQQKPAFIAQKDEKKPETGIIEHKNCELGWINFNSHDQNSAALFQILKDKGYMQSNSATHNDDLISFHLTSKLKGEREEEKFTEILNAGISFLSPGNMIMISMSNGAGDSSDTFFNQTKSFRRKSLATDIDFIFRFVKKTVPECRVKQ